MLNLRFHKQSLFCALVGFLLFSTNSTGFDFYSHSASYYYYDRLINHADLLFEVIVLPRYMLLSYIYEVFSRVGLPLGIVASFLITFPIYNINKEIFINGLSKKTNSYSLVDIAVMLLCFLFCFYYSGLSLVLLWFIALLRTKNPIFLLGAGYHPVGVILYYVGVLFARKHFLKLSFYLCLLLFLFYLFSTYSMFTSSSSGNIRFHINLSSLSNIFAEVYRRKMQEISLLFFVAIFSFLGKGKFIIAINVFSKIYIHKYIYNLGLIAMVSFFVFVTLGKPTLMNSLLTLNYNQVIYASWFDWGGKDLSISYFELYKSRYW